MYNKAAELGTIPDDMNPIFLFSITHSHLLLRIVADEIDVVALAKRELENRGYDIPKVKTKSSLPLVKKTAVKKTATKKGKTL